MARVTHVKSAQQRYATKPVIDPATGEQRRTPVMRNGVQRVTKRGKPIFMDVTVRDLDQPKPMPTCDYSGCKVAAERDGDKTIRVGDAYKHISPKSGPYGGRTLNRHAACPTWNVWDYSSSLSARIAEIEHNGQQAIDDAIAEAEDTSAIEEALEGMASDIEALAEEKRESASNIEEGFGTSTSQSDEMNEQADSLDQWAEEVRGVEVPSPDDYACEECDGTEQVDCDTCSGDGEDENGDDCPDCEGGKVECEDCTDGHDLDAWREALQGGDIELPECPV